MEYILRAAAVPALSLGFLKRLLAAFGMHLHDHVIPHARNNYHPHILGHRSLGLLSGALVCLKFFTLAAAAWSPAVPAFSSAITSENVIRLTNESRTLYNLSSLKYNSVLAKAAQAKAEDMLSKGYFSHSTPEGKTPWDFIDGARYDYLLAGENLAVNFTEAEHVEEAWMNSPGHKANILNGNFEEIGIGIAQGQYQGHNAIFVVQMFGTPAEENVNLASAPTLVSLSPVPAPQPAAQAVGGSGAQALGAADEELADSPEKNVYSQAKTEQFKILTADLNLEGENLTLQVQAPMATKVLAQFGPKAVMLSPTQQNTWKASLDLESLAKEGQPMKITAYDLQGAEQSLRLAEFSGSTARNYKVLEDSGQGGKSQAVFFGKVFNPSDLERQIFLTVAAVLLACLILAIGIKRHIQHPALIANSSFVVALAVALYAL